MEQVPKVPFSLTTHRHTFEAILLVEWRRCWRCKGSQSLPAEVFQPPAHGHTILLVGNALCVDDHTREPQGSLPEISCGN